MNPEPSHPFIHFVRNKPELQKRFWPYARFDDFLDVFIQTANGLGFLLDRAGLESAVYTPGQKNIPDLSETAESAVQPGWIPYRVRWDGTEPVLEWCYTGTERCHNAFFEDTVRCYLRHPFNRLFRFQTSMDVLNGIPSRIEGLEPSGFIFHLSRSGSTLISQMLASLPQCVVIPEAFPIDEVLRAHFKESSITGQQKKHWLRSIIHLLGQPQAAGERYYFIKFDSWHTLSLPFIRKVYPDVPWIFVYRNPAEILVSHTKNPGYHMVPGMIDPAWFGWEKAWNEQIPLPEYGARVLQSIAEAALDHYDPQRCLLINYEELPDAVHSKIFNFFSIQTTPGQLETMQSVTRSHAKYPNQSFENDTEQKRDDITPQIAQLAGEWLDPLYTKLEKLRLDSK